MSINYPRLDDRSYDDLLKDAKKRLHQQCADWSGSDPSDPGVILLELFSYLTEEMLYRLNKLPEKSYVEFLKLLGVEQRPPVAASVDLQFSLKEPAEKELFIPRHTAVTIANPSMEAPIFMTIESASIKPGEKEVMVKAFHCLYHEAEDLGKGDGKSGFVAQLKNRPIVQRDYGNLLKTIIAVETDDLIQSSDTLRVDEVTYKIWEEVDTVRDLSCSQKKFYLERSEGIVRFPLEMYDDQSNERFGLSHKGKQIRAWYYTGGGGSGNVMSNTLTVIISDNPLLRESGVSVTNPQKAAGGQGSESIESILKRGPLAIHSLDRVITAQDYELCAEEDADVVKAYAYTKAALWQYAERGVVSLFMVPTIESFKQEEIESEDTLQGLYVAGRDQQIIERVGKVVEKKKSLGVRVELSWAPIKVLNIHGTIILHPYRLDKREIKEQALQLLYDKICGVKRESQSSLVKGHSINISELYTLLMSIPGVSHVKNLHFNIARTPHREVTSLCADPFVEKRFYATALEHLYFSDNDGADWHSLLCRKNETLTNVTLNPVDPGNIAFISDRYDPEHDGCVGSSIHYSIDNGESWTEHKFSMPLYDCAWLQYDNKNYLMIATERGLFKVDTSLHDDSDTPPQPMYVDKRVDGFYAVATVKDARGNVFVAVASTNRKGVFISPEGGEPGTYLDIGLSQQDVRTITFEESGSRLFLWMGTTVVGDQDGDGCFRLEVTDGHIIASNSTPFKQGWQGGSCKALALCNGIVYAATHRRGLLSLRWQEDDSKWEQPVIDCGLPMRDLERLFYPVNDVVISKGRVLTATEVGVYAQTEEGSYKPVSKKEKYDRVTIPQSWFLCSGKHEIALEEIHEEREY